MFQSKTYLSKACRLFVILHFLIGSLVSAQQQGMHAQGRQEIQAGISLQQSLTIKGKALYGRKKLDYELIINGDGKLKASISGFHNQTTVYDGKAVWRTENGAGPYNIEYMDREIWLATNWLISNYWKNDSPEVEVLDDSSDGSPMFKLRNGKMIFKINMGSALPLPMGFEAINSPGNEKVTFKGYDLSSGVAIPKHILFEHKGESMEEYFIESVQVANTVDASIFLRPDRLSENHRFLKGISSELEVKMASTGHLFVKPLINGQDVGWFLFDSAASTSSINKSIAEKLNMPIVGESISGGLGGVIGYRNILKSNSLQLGPLQIDNINFKEQPEGGITAMISEILGEKIVGTLGWDIYLRSIVKVDAKNAKISIHDPEHYSIDDKYKQKLHLAWQVPFVEAKFEGNRQGLFMYDTGAGSDTVMFHSYAVEQLELLKDRDLSKLVTITGVGGEVGSYKSKLNWFEIAGIRLEDINAHFNIGYDGEAELYSYGLIGGGMLEPFNVVLDYVAAEIGFIPKK